ncbi:MAG TPA: hypothetical protein VMR21_11065 [Vicinamibacteria bacterium]|nr:hypothetical protein [Vicinamibacteria bacterium]
MPSWVRTLVPLVLLAAGVPALARGQTSDVLFGGWTWRPRDQGSRPAGFGGSYVAVADSVRTAAVNPAGIALIPNAEAAGGTAALWAGLGYSLRPRAVALPVPPMRPAQATEPPPCEPGRQSRPWALAVFAEQALDQENQIDVVRGPGLSESGRLFATAEEVGASVAKGVAPWLNLGVTVAWRHVRLEGQSAVRDLSGAEVSRVILGGDSNKARAIAGALLTFGPESDPTAFRIGLAYHQDLFQWSVERTAIDAVAGTVSGPRTIQVSEPPVLAAGVAWRLSDAWLVSAELDYVWYERVQRALESNTDAATADQFRLRSGFEPRFGIETTRPSPTGGYFKLRGGVRRETSGRLQHVGGEGALRQAFEAPPAAFRAAIGASLLGEFYENGFRLDVDISQVVVERLTSVRAAGRRRLSFAITVRI